MRKRFLCILLAVIMVLGIVASAPMPVNAYTNLKTSDALVTLLTNFEGFTEVCVKDGTQRSVGFGTRCDVCNSSDPNYPNTPCKAYTKATPISREHATQLMKNYLTMFENEVNTFGRKYNLSFTQNEFDALISFTYNCGGGWMSEYYDSEGTFRKAIVNRSVGDALVYAFGLWSKSGNTVSIGHVRRRMIEADVYLNGNYNSNIARWPENLRYVFLDGNGGTTRYYYQTFHAAEVCPIRAEFTSIPKDGQGNNLIFDGWYTKPEGGVKVESITNVLQNGHVLYAHWKNSNGQTVTINTDNSHAVDVNVIMPNYWPNTLYEGPGSFYSEVRKTAYREQLHITKIVTGKDGAQWGYCGDGWVPLSSTNYNSVVSGTWYEVTATDLVVRTGPSVGETDTGVKKQPGNQVLVVATQEEAAANRTWAKMSDGNWICIRNGDVTWAVVMDPQPSKPAEVSGNTITGISWISKPTRTEYALNGRDVLPDLTGGTILVRYSDPYRNAEIPITRLMVSGFDNSKEGVNTITVTVGGKSVTFDVNIVYKVLENISIISQPTKTTYFVGEELSKDGMQVMANYSNNTSTQITGYTISGYDKNKVGVQTVTVSYMGKTATFTVTVKGKTVSGITLVSAPKKLEYVQGTGDLVLDGGFIQVNYVEGGSDTTSITKDMIPLKNNQPQFNNTVLGKQTIQVTYGGKSVTFDVTVIKPTITFLNYDGSVIGTVQYALGEEVKAPATPTRPDDADGNSYEFVSWDRELLPCTGSTSYMAVYKLKFKIGDLDRNKAINEDDVIYLLRHLVYGNDMYPISATKDLNKDGSENEDDVIYLLRHLVYGDGQYPLG